MFAIETVFFKLTPPPVRRAIKTAAIRIVKELLIPPLLKKKLDLAPGPDSVSVHLLVSDTTCRMGALAVRSLQHFSGLQWNIWVHDDGSLSPDQMEQIRRAIPGCKLLPRAQIEPEMDAALTGYPVCRENRKKHNWFLKVFDAHHFAPSGKYIVLDSDLLFFDMPREIIE